MFQAFKDVGDIDINLTLFVRGACMAETKDRFRDIVGKDTSIRYTD